MTQKQAIPLLGRLAVQLKMISMEQLQAATREQGRDPEKRLGDIMMELGLVDEAQMQKLQKVQRDLVIKHRAKQALKESDEPARELPRARSGQPTRVPQRPVEERVAAPRKPVSEPVAATPPPAADPFEHSTPDLEEDLFGESAPSATPAPTPPTPPTTTPPPVAAASEPLELATEPPPATAATQQSPASAPPASAERRQRPEPNLDELELEGDSLDLQLHACDDADLQRLNSVLQSAVAAGASDIHVHSGAPIRQRVNGELGEVAAGEVSAEEVERMVSASLTPAQRLELEHRGELDLCYDVDGVGRFRTNVYRQQRGFDAVFRAIPALPPTLDDLGLPNALAKHTNYHQGMVLVTGPAGCGKSSTMAALVNLINEERDEHILTIEDPIEYIHKSKRCLVNQRHAGRDTASFARALRGALREDPDIIVIGELRDLETISLAMTAAETGHFVLATLHTSNAVRTINRMIGAFPSNQQGQVRTMLSESLRAVISQRLVVAADGSGRVPALEMLVINKAIGNLIRDQKTVQIKSAIQTGANHGMYLLEQSLNELVATGKIKRDEALRFAEDKKLITA